MKEKETGNLEMKEAKKALRKELLHRQSILSEEYKKEASLKIAEKVFALKEYDEAKVIFIYAGTSNEVDTSIIIKEALSGGKRVALPKIISFGIMEAWEIRSMEDTLPEKHGILEPGPGSRKIPPEDIDLALIPCLAFRKDGYRIGYGGGFYDRFLPKGRFHKVIIAFDKMRCDDLPTDDQDQKADAVLTERTYYKGY